MVWVVLKASMVDGEKLRKRKGRNYVLSVFCRERIGKIRPSLQSNQLAEQKATSHAADFDNRRHTIGAAANVTGPNKSPPASARRHQIMPLYTVYHPTSLVAHSRSQIATVITDSHVTATGAPGFLVKVVFIPLEWSSFFAGGHAKDKLLRIVGVIRAGRSKEERQKLLLSIYEGIKRIEKNDVNRYEIEIHLEEMKTEV
jgi:phenylpyruvate tautomerase PptA (4-oxalocrotonate tautomerase family)